MKRHVVPEDWVGQTAAIVASGPSVEKFDFSRIAGLRTIAVKDGYLKVPDADVLMIGDHRYAKRNPDLSLFRGPLILYTDPEPCPPVLADGRTQFIPKVAGRGLSWNRSELRGTFTTTVLAINYAALRGARRILLVGVDGKPGAGNRRWFVGAHCDDRREDWPERYNRQRFGYSRIVDDLKRHGVEVFNLNMNSAVKYFPFLKEGV